MKFTPSNDAEGESREWKPLPKGEYGFTVMESEEVISKKSGKQMVKLKLNVHGPEYDVHVYDYFADWFSEWKLKHFCECVGDGLRWLSGNVDFSRSSMKGKTGHVKLAIEDDPQYGTKNVVKDYLPDESQRVQVPVIAPDDIPKVKREPDDDVPF